MDILALSTICRKQKIAVTPVVFDMGTDDYTVIFEPELKGSGYVKLSVNGKEKIYWVARAGIIATHLD